MAGVVQLVKETLSYPNRWAGWQAQVLAAAHLPVTQPNIDFLTAWHNAEGSNAKNNPLNTTAYAPVPATVGTGAINSAGVQNYATPAAGTAATAAFLQMPNFSAIYSALQSGNPARYVSAGQTNYVAVHNALGTWGSNANSVLNGYFPDILHYKGVSDVPVLPVPEALLPSTVAGAAGAGAVLGLGSRVLSASSSLDALKAIFSFVTDPNNILRSLEVLAGGVMILVGAFLLAKQVGLTTSVPTPAGAVASAAGSAVS